MRDRTYEDRLNAASALNLLLAAIVVCNTVHIQACIRRLQADGETLSDDDLRYPSPLMRNPAATFPMVFAEACLNTKLAFNQILPGMTFLIHLRPNAEPPIGTGGGNLSAVVLSHSVC